MLNWVLFITFLIPNQNIPIEMEMRFSQKRYCTFAMEKVLESQPMFVYNGDSIAGLITNAECKDTR